MTSYLARQGSRRLSLTGAGLAIIIGFIVTLGHAANLHQLTAVYGVYMRPVTSISFILIGLALVAVSKRWMTTAATCTMAVATAMLVSVALELIVAFLPVGDVARTIQPHLPSVGTIVGFMLSACGLFVWLVGNGPLRPIRRACSLLTFGIGLTATIGYIIGNPHLYWSQDHLSVAMALHTAIGLMFVGIAVHEIEMRRQPATKELTPDWSTPEHAVCRAMIEKQAQRIDHLEKKLELHNIMRS